MTPEEFRSLKTDLLDPRSERDEGPVMGAAWIPVDRLYSSAHFLSPKGETVRVCDFGEVSLQAVRWLQAGGRSCILESQIERASGDRAWRLWNPNEFLMDALQGMRAGRAADLGCGTGRDCVCLAATGWRVLAVDRLLDALERVESLARSYGVEARVRKLRSVLPLRRALKPKQQLCAMSFAFHPSWIAQAIEMLAPGGSLVVEAFTPVHRAANGVPKRATAVVDAFTLSLLCAGLEIEHLSESWRESGRHTARLLAHKLG